MWISCSRQAEAKSARDNLQGLSDPSRPCKLGTFPCQYSALRNTVSLCRFIDGCTKKLSLYCKNIEKDVLLHRAKKKVDQNLSCFIVEKNVAV